MVDMGTAVWRGVADFGGLYKAQKQAAAGFDDVARKSDDAGKKGESFGSRVTTGLGKVGPKMKSVGRDMSIGLTAPLAFLGVQAVQSFSDFEASITAAGAKTEATGAQIEQMKQVALDMGAKTKFSAGEAAVAMDNMAAAGFDANGVMAALPGVMLAAQAAGEDLGMTADITAKAINAFGLEASDATHVADVFATAANTSAVDIHGLGEALAHAGQLGSSANQDLEDVVAVIGRLVDMGVPAASAGAGIRQAISSLKAPTKQGSKVIDELGLKFRDVRGQMLPMPDLLKAIDTGLSESNPKFEAQAKAAGLTDTAYRDLAMSQLFGVEGAQAMTLALSGGKPVMLDVQKDTEKLARLQQGLAQTMGKDAAAAWIKEHTNAGKFVATGYEAVRALGALNRASDGTSKKIGDIMSDTTQARLDQMKGSFETLAITLLTQMAPTLTKIVNGITNGVNAFAKWAKAHPTLAKIVVVLAAILAVAGPLLVAFGLIAGAISAIAALGAPVILTILAVVAAIAILIAAGILIYKHWDQIKAFLISVWNSIKSTAVSVWQAIADFFVGIWSWITNQASSIWNGIAGFFSSLWSTVTGAIVTAWNAVGAFLSGVWNGILAVASAVWNGIVAAVMLPVRGMVAVVQATLAVFKGWWDAFWGLFGGLITAVWNLIVAVVQLGAAIVVSTVRNIWNGLVTVAQLIWNQVVAVVMTAWNLLKAGAQAVWGFISKYAQITWNGIVAIISAVVNKIVAVAKAAWALLKAGAQTAWNGIKTAAQAAWLTIQALIINPIRALWGKLQGPINTVKAGLAAAWTAVKSAATTAWNGLVSILSTLVGKIATTVSGVKDKIVGAFSGAAKWLWQAGVSIIKGLIDGVTSKINDLTGVLKGITDKIPDWKGPAPVDRKLLFKSGLLIMSGLSRGIQAGRKALRKTLGHVTMSIGPVVDDTLGLPPGARPPGAPPAAGAVSAPRIERDDSDTARGGNTYNITAINPVGETTAETVSKQVTRLAVLGVGAA